MSIKKCVLLYSKNLADITFEKVENLYKEFEGVESLEDEFEPKTRHIKYAVAIFSTDVDEDLVFVKEKYKETIGITGIKLFLFCIIFLPLAVMMGFRNEKLVAILVMLGSATTSSCFIMAKNMGHEGKISSCSVMVTTLFSSFSLTMWLFILKTLQYI